MVMNDNIRSWGRMVAEERLRRVQGLGTRDKLRQAITDYDIHRSSKDNEWYYNSNNHTVRE